MSGIVRVLLRWLPAFAVMIVIFLFSAQPSYALPDLGWADRVVKKGGHMIGYALLATCLWRGFQFAPERRWLAWLLAVLYAVSDEVHQSFVPGRFASAWDVLVFDNLGALISLWLLGLHKAQRSDLLSPIVGEGSAKS